MSQQDSYSSTAMVATAHVGVPEPSGEAGAPVVRVDVPLLLLTWGVFIVMTLVLYKLAWKPILAGLDMRERRIRKALDDAERMRVETEAAEKQRQQMMLEARQQAEGIMTSARDAAVEVSRIIHTRAGEEAQSLLADARRDIEAATAKAKTELRRETGELAIALAAKIVGENMDTARNQTLVEKLIKEI